MALSSLCFSYTSLLLKTANMGVFVRNLLNGCFEMRIKSTPWCETGILSEYEFGNVFNIGSYFGKLCFVTATIITHLLITHKIQSFKIFQFSVMIYFCIYEHINNIFRMFSSYNRLIYFNYQLLWGRKQAYLSIDSFPLLAVNCYAFPGKILQRFPIAFRMVLNSEFTISEIRYESRLES